MVGWNDGPITAGYATGSVTSTGVFSEAGGLVGLNQNTVNASYATGSVSGDEEVGGLVGDDQHGSVTRSYFDGTTSGRTFGIGTDDANNDNTVNGSENNSLPGRTTAQLRQPTGYAGIYAGWNVNIDGASGGDDPWDFGGSQQYPALKVDFNNDGTATWQEFGPQAASSVDYNTDGDGLIDVNSLARLNAIRWDLDGDGLSDDAGYLAAYPSFHAVQGRNLGCPSGCVGYELTANLDFDTGTAGDRTDDDYHNGGAGWAPIGDDSNPFTATFDGNGHVIANLFIDRSSTDDIGLFGHAGSTAVIRNLGLTGVSVSGSNKVGGLVGRNQGMVTTNYATGSVSGIGVVGGLVGDNRGNVTASYATASVSGGTTFGGLIGSNQGTVTASYATGSVSANNTVGGLVGRNSGGTVTASYATGSVSGRQSVGGLVGGTGGTVTNSYYDGDTSGRTFGIGSDDDNNDNTVNSGETNSLPGKTTTQMHTPTGYAGIYAAWNVSIDGDNTADNPWDFGTSGQYPALKVDFDGNGTATWQEFGAQRLFDNDDDDDGLIEVDSLAKLNAIRWDLDGNGAPATANAGAYALAFGHSTADACAYDHDSKANTPNRCVGYELTADLDFDEDGDGNRNDTHNTGSGWSPIGSNTTPFTAVFEGNGHTIANLFISRRPANYVGLFGDMGSAAVIRNLGLTGRQRHGRRAPSAGWRGGTQRQRHRHLRHGQRVRPPRSRRRAAWAGTSSGSVAASYVAGERLRHLQEVLGGLVGQELRAASSAGYATGSVSGVRGNSYRMGGLVG